MYLSKHLKGAFFSLFSPLFINSSYPPSYACLRSTAVIVLGGRSCLVGSEVPTSQKHPSSKPLKHRKRPLRVKHKKVNRRTRAHTKGIIMSDIKKDKKEKKDKLDKKEKKEKKNEKELPTVVSSSSPAAAVEDYVEDYAKNQAKVEDICKTYPNNNCEDCNATGTRWASVNHGVFVCIRCSGIHRSMGVHISKVKSSNMDKWTAAEVNMMESIGNRRGKELYEANLPKGHKPFTGAESDNTMRDFIQKKYADKAFATSGIEEILKKIGKSTGYTSKSGRPKHSSSSAAATSDAAQTAESSAAQRKAGHSDPMSALFGKDSVLKSSGTSKKEKKASKNLVAIDGVFGPCTCGADQHDEKRSAVLAAFGVVV